MNTSRVPPGRLLPGVGAELPAAKRASRAGRDLPLRLFDWPLLQTAVCRSDHQSQRDNRGLHYGVGTLVTCPRRLPCSSQKSVNHGRSCGSGPTHSEVALTPYPSPQLAPECTAARCSMLDAHFIPFRRQRGPVRAAFSAVTKMLSAYPCVSRQRPVTAGSGWCRRCCRPRSSLRSGRGAPCDRRRRPMNGCRQSRRC